MSDKNTDHFADLDDAALSRRVAEAAGWVDCDNYSGIDLKTGKRYYYPRYAISLDAIAALEREAGLRVDVYAMANPDDGYHVDIGGVWGSADTEPRARCLAYLAWKQRKELGQ